MIVKKKKPKAGIVLTDAQMAKKYRGSGLASEISVMPEDALWIPSRSIYLNYTTGGGVPYGKICEIFGGESSGKCCGLNTRLFLPDMGIIEMGNLTQLSKISTELGIGKITGIIDTGTIKTVKITTKAGFEFVGGYSNHKIKLRDLDGNWEWHYIRNLKIGDNIPIAYGMNVFGKLKYIKGYPLDKDMGYALGLLCGDGNITIDHISMTAEKKCLSLLEFLIQYLKRFKVETQNHQGVIQSQAEIQLRKGNYNLQRSGKELGNWLKHFPELINNSHNKRVPKLILTSPKETQIAFIQGYFDTDGNSSKKSPQVSVTSVSKELIQDIQMMLLNFGIVSNITIKKTSWVNKNTGKKNKSITNRLTLRGYQAMKFKDMIGFRLNYKFKILSQSRRRNTKPMFESIKEYSSYDIVKLPDYLFPRLENFYKNLIAPNKYLGSQLRYWLYNKGTKKYKISGSIPLKNLYTLLKYTQNKGDFDKVLYDYTQSQYFYDPIVSIELENQPTKDIEVSPSHSYISNGFISHNTLVAMDYAYSTQYLGGMVFWNDAEQSFDPCWAEQNGLDLNKIIIYNETSIERISDWAADMAVTWRSKLKNNEPILIVTDSVAALDCEENINSQQTDAKAEMGNRAKAFYKYLRIRNQLFSDLGITLIFINQLRSKVGATKFEDPDTTPAGNAMKFFAHQRLAFFQKKQITQGLKERKIWLGNEVSVRMKKNKVAPPRPTFTTEIYFNAEYGRVGFERYTNLVELLVKTGVVKRRGSNFYFKDEKLATSKDNFQELLEADDLLRRKLLRRTKVNTLSVTQGKINRLNNNNINRYPVTIKAPRKTEEEDV